MLFDAHAPVKLGWDSVADPTGNAAPALPRSVRIGNPTPRRGKIPWRPRTTGVGPIAPLDAPRLYVRSRGAQDRPQIAPRSNPAEATAQLVSAIVEMKRRNPKFG